MADAVNQDSGIIYIHTIQNAVMIMCLAYKALSKLYIKIMVSIHTYIYIYIYRISSINTPGVLLFSRLKSKLYVPK